LGFALRFCDWIFCGMRLSSEVALLRSCVLAEFGLTCPSLLATVTEQRCSL
jgi:hypothetical protein